MREETREAEKKGTESVETRTHPPEAEASIPNPTQATNTEDPPQGQAPPAPLLAGWGKQRNATTNTTTRKSSVMS